MNLNLSNPACLLTCIITGCSTYFPPNSELATVTLSKAGENRTQLEQVIKHYITVDSDPKKLEAEYYLIANMEDKAGYAATDTLQYQLLLDSFFGRAGRSLWVGSLPFNHRQMARFDKYGFAVTYRGAN